MQALLFLAHRIPYPPNKGDKIRSFNLLKQLTQDYRVYLGAFIDDLEDRCYASTLQDLCQEAYLVPLKPRLRKWKSLSGLITGEPLSLPYYRDGSMQSWVRQTLEQHNICQVFVYSSTMAQYVYHKDECHRVIDFVDVDSEKWRHYAQHHRGLMSWLYQREAQRLLNYERRIAAEFNASLFVTEEEAALFRWLAPEVAGQVMHVGNGVDSDYFSPHRIYPNPYPAGQKVLVFTGAMDYWANGDAVRWFVHKVFSSIKAQVPNACLYIVGARPPEAVRRLAEREGVQVTGAVKDIRPYLAHACAAVAPLRVARGLQNKVLEAMAMARPVLATPAAMQGIQGASKLRKLVSDEASVLAQRGIELLKEEDYGDYGRMGRELVSRYYDWQEQLKPLDRLFREGLRKKEKKLSEAEELINSAIG